jgi:hypothetical protein
MTPDELLAAAREVMGREQPVTAGLWPRASALLGRQALEEAMEELWHRKRLDLAWCPVRSQLLCLPEYLSDRDVARRAAYAWSALSHACHHRPYELAPTAPELAGWLDLVGQVIDAVDGARPP